MKFLPSSLCVILSIDLLIRYNGIEVLRLFESQQCAVILLRKWHSCLLLPNLFSFEFEVGQYILICYSSN